jgi:hypothetical protein
MSQSLLLQSGEQTVHSWNALLTNKVVVRKVERGMIRNKVRTGKQNEHQKGVLVLTNRRLAWMQRHGRFNKSYHLTNEIPLEHLSGIAMGGTLFKYVTLSNGQDTYQFNIKDVGSKEFQYFKDMIMRQRDNALASASQSHVTREVIKTEVVMISCEYCKALMPQTSIYCPSCAAPRKG